MNHYIGIDLGTTNSAICSFDGSDTRIWKNTEQHDVTPSAILFLQRGNKYLGERAYNTAPWQHEGAAVLFKRVMGTSTPINIPALGVTMTPEQCSAEILKLLFGYLQEEIRNDPQTGTVITVPAAFNQMQKDATRQAAEMAGIGNVALMQEPVAAVMSIMRKRKTDGMFLVYDLGGGTLDIAIAESLNGRVNLLANGGIAMCGGRDFDRLVMDNIVKPWLFDNFDLPSDFSANDQFVKHRRIALWAIEKAKIGLSSNENTSIFLSDEEMRCTDMSGDDMFLDIPISRSDFDQLISSKLSDSLDAARFTLQKAGLSSHDLENIVFIGGPTNYKPLRDKIAFELGIPGSMEVNPMTAVAEGASIYAESIDWTTESRTRKDTRAKMSPTSLLNVSLNYQARTTDTKALITIQLSGSIPIGSEFQIDSFDTGWTSGRLPLKQESKLEVILTKSGSNVFKVYVFGSQGRPISLDNDTITITKTAATIDAIPASHSISVEALDSLGGSQSLEYLVKAGDSLPKKGKKTFIAAEALKAGSLESINFKLWEGEIENPISDNRSIGVFKIMGTDFSEGVIPAGAILEFEYMVDDACNISVAVSIPIISCTFNPSKRNLYSRQEGQINYSDEDTITVVIEDAENTLERIDSLSAKIDDLRLEQAREKLAQVLSLELDNCDAETTQEASENVLSAKKLIDEVRRTNLKEIRQIDLDLTREFFREHVKQYALPSEITVVDNLVKTAQQSINLNDKKFEQLLTKLKGKNYEILWRQDWFIVEQFKIFANRVYHSKDKLRYIELSKQGQQYMRDGNIEQLRQVVIKLIMLRIGGSSDQAIFDPTNIVRG